jgi:hypothetical protein
MVEDKKSKNNGGNSRKETSLMADQCPKRVESVPSGEPI